MGSIAGFIARTGSGIQAGERGEEWANSGSNDSLLVHRAYLNGASTPNVLTVQSGIDYKRCLEDKIVTIGVISHDSLQFVRTRQTGCASAAALASTRPAGHPNT